MANSAVSMQEYAGKNDTHQREQLDAMPNKVLSELQKTLNNLSVLQWIATSLQEAEKAA